MAHINPVFVIESSELAIDNGQDRRSSKFLKSTRPGDPEGSSRPSRTKEIKNMIRSKWKWGWIFNAIILLIMGLMIMILEFNIIPFRALGYQCNDPSLSHKFIGDTISFALIIAVTLLLPLVAVFIVEFVVSINMQNFRNSLKKKTVCLALHWYGQFFVGLLVLLLIVQLSKSIIAEPRPHFFDTCKPDKYNCTGYVTDYKCTNEDMPQRHVRDSFRSFPSGHAALGFFVAIFLAWFFQSRIPSNDYLVVPLLQCIVLSWALLCALTRITDHRHHWWDVLIGGITGVLVAVFTVKALCKSFRPPNSGKAKKQDRNIREAGSSINNWYKKVFAKSTSTQQSEDRELREVK